MLQIWNGKQREGHLYAERFSRSCEKFSVFLFVVSNPLVDGCLRNITHRRQFISINAKAGKEESSKSFLFLNGKKIQGVWFKSQVVSRNQGRRKR